MTEVICGNNPDKNKLPNIFSSSILQSFQISSDDPLEIEEQLLWTQQMQKSFHMFWKIPTSINKIFC